jgi:hypothetical protein
VEGENELFYNTPGIRLGLQSLLNGPDSHSVDGVYDAVLAAVSRNVHPDRLVGYVTSVLRNARPRASDREPTQPAARSDSEARSRETESRAGKAVPTVASDLLQPPDQHAQKKWNDALVELESQMTGPTFETWIRPASLLSWTAEGSGNGTPHTRVVIGTPNGLIRDWLESRLAGPIRRALSTAAGHATELRFRVCDPAEAHVHEVVQPGVETPCPDSES